MISPSCWVPFGVGSTLGVGTALRVGTVWREEVAVVDGDAERVLLRVADRELHGVVPLGVERVVEHLRLVLLRSHRHLAVRVTLACMQDDTCEQRHQIIFDPRYIFL